MPKTPKERARFRQLDREQIKYESTWQPLIEQAINDQIAPFIAALKSDGPEYALKNINKLITPDALYDCLYKLWVTVGTKAANSEYGYLINTYGKELSGQKAFASFGFNKIFVNIMSRIFRATGGERIVKITQTEHERVSNELAVNIQNHKYTNYELAERLQSADIPRRRSKVIARTETAYAASEGAEIGVKQTGFKMMKTWLSVRDKRTRHLPEDKADHRVMDGVSVYQDVKFMVPSKGGISLMDRTHDLKAPKWQTIMCRCKTTYTPLRDGNGRLIRNLPNPNTQE